MMDCCLGLQLRLQYRGSSPSDLVRLVRVAARMTPMMTQCAEKPGRVSLGLRLLNGRHQVSRAHDDGPCMWHVFCRWQIHGSGLDVCHHVEESAITGEDFTLGYAAATALDCPVP
jgi:hypothetical protein